MIRHTRRWTPWCFLLPHGLFFATFVVAPLLFGFYISLHRWGMFSGREAFVGLKYYIRLFDTEFVRTGYYWKSLLVTLEYVVLSVPPLVFVAFSLAVLLDARELGETVRRVLRTVYLLPAALAITVVAVIWRWVLLYDNGLLNSLLAMAGIGKVAWLTEQPGAWASILLTTLWCSVGWNMVLFLVALQGIPDALYEAAVIDGANRRQAFLYVTLPNMRRTLLFVSLLQVIASFNLFAQPQLMTGGGPERSTLPVMLFIYNDAFSSILPRIGNGCALAFTTGLFMLAFLVAQYRLVIRRKPE
jgi:multiple sugar transport system permease protein